MAQILSADGSVFGTGFLTGPRSDEVLLTCAHVVAQAGYGPGSRLRVEFPQIAGRPRAEGTVLPEAWTDPQGQDIAVIRLDELPPSATLLAVGAADNCAGHWVSSIGFPENGEDVGSPGRAQAGRVLPGAAGYPVLHLNEANSITVGFSGAPLVDDRTGLVIGMVRSITPSDVYGRGLATAQAVPTETLRKVWPALGSGPGRCPYLGLGSFTRLDAPWFHGRDTAVTWVLEKLRPGPHGLLLVGPSGSGKSSLIRAGVLERFASDPRMGGGRWLPLYLEHPGQDLAAALDRQDLLPGARAVGIGEAVAERLSKEPGCVRVVLFIDQFEELLTRAGPKSGLSAEARETVDRLTGLLTSYAPVTVVMIMRSDFQPRLEEVAHELLDRVDGVRHLPSDLSREDLKDIITKPAEAVGVSWDPGLPDRIAVDVLAAAGGRAPAHLLPLLEITLSRLWDMREDGRLVGTAYGGIATSLNEWAHKAMGALSAGQREAAERILAALVRRDESRRIPDVRDKVPLDELRKLAGHSDADAVLAVLSAERLVVTRGPDPHPVDQPDRPYAELIHDWLLTGWDDLSRWVRQYEAFNSWRHRAARQLALRNRRGKRSDLLHGSDLEEGLKWLRQGLLASDVDRETFVRRSRQWQLLLRSLAAVMLSIALVTVSTLAVRLELQLERTRQALYETQREQRLAVALQLTQRAEQLRRSDPWLALQLGIAAHRTTPDPRVKAALVKTMTTTRLTASLPGRLLGFTRAGRLVLDRGVRSRSRIATWDPAPGAGSGRTRIRSGSVPRTGDAGADGRVFVTFEDSGRVRLWTLTDGDRVVPASGEFGSRVGGAVLSPDGRRLAIDHLDGTMTVWDVTDAADPRRSGPAVRVSKDSGTRAVHAFSPDGRLVVTASERTLTLWSTGADRRRVATTRLPALPRRTDAMSAYDVHDVAFSPDGHTLAAATRGNVLLWDVTRVDRPTLLGKPLSGGSGVAFGPDGTGLATADEHGSVTVWDVRDRVRPRRTDRFAAPQNGGARSVRYTPDGTHLVVGYDPAGSIAQCGVAEMEHDCRQGLFDDDYTVVWAMRPPDRPAPLGEPVSTTASPYALAVSPDGHTVVTARPDGLLVFQDIGVPGRPSRTGTLRPGSRGRVTALAYRPDGRVLAVGGERGTIELWRTEDGGARPVRTQTVAPFRRPVTVLRFSADGRVLDAADALDAVRWTTGEPVPRPVGSWTRPRTPRVAIDPSTGTLARVTPHNGVYPSAGSMVSDQVELWPFSGEVGPQPGSGARELTGPGSMGATIAFSPRGHVLAVGGEDGTLTLWYVSSDVTARFHSLSLPVGGHRTPITAIAFSPDGSTIATGATDGTVLVWAASDSGPLRLGDLLTSHHGEVTTLAFSPDGRTLLTIGGDGGSDRQQDGELDGVLDGELDRELRLWDTGSLAELRHTPDVHACRLAGTGLGEESWATLIPSLPYTKTCR
ncbi:trypsin-like peptidase domain-containing protein [Streptomyces sp. NPDC059894]|uniref:nSTAND1 domain-containing NTPase n=1 Tax=unclassified Streptomyces TaxID=2593676 RepID=UPI00365EDAAF